MRPSRPTARTCLQSVSLGAGVCPWHVIRMCAVRPRGVCYFMHRCQHADLSAACDCALYLHGTISKAPRRSCLLTSTADISEPNVHVRFPGACVHVQCWSVIIRSEGPLERRAGLGSVSHVCLPCTQNPSSERSFLQDSFESSTPTCTQVLSRWLVIRFGFALQPMGIVDARLAMFKA